MCHCVARGGWGAWREVHVCVVCAAQDGWGLCTEEGFGHPCAVTAETHGAHWTLVGSNTTA
jgi:hypothetical protein